MVTADAQLIPPLMYDHDVPGTGRPFASWYVTFATNRMVLAISPKSPLAGQFTASNWFKLLTRPGVRFGLADPRFDPAGYRALMVLQLAERYYHDPIIFENVVMGQFTTPVTVEREGRRDVIQVPEILETQPGSSLVLRDESIELDALLETGDLDCALSTRASLAKAACSTCACRPPSTSASSATHTSTAASRSSWRRSASPASNPCSRVE